MAQSRIEKFREYRKSIINSETNVNVKTQIETSLETTSTESKTLPSEKEAVFLKRIYLKKSVANVIFFTVVGSIVILLVVFGLILFK